MEVYRIPNCNVHYTLFKFISAQIIQKKKKHSLRLQIFL